MIKDMMQKQKEVDSLIAEKFEGDFKSTLPKRIIAFKVEVSEFANEIGSFKYWKKSHVRNKERILDEGADCLAFLFSIVNSYDLTKKVYRNFDEKAINKIDSWDTSYQTVDEIIDEKINLLLSKWIGQEWEDLLIMIYHIFEIVELCGYSSEELKNQYYTKSMENLHRAKVGY